MLRLISFLIAVYLVYRFIKYLIKVYMSPNQLQKIKKQTDYEVIDVDYEEIRDEDESNEKGIGKDRP